MFKKVKIFILVIFIIFSFHKVKIFANDSYEYIPGITNLLLIGSNEEYDMSYNFFIVLTIDANKKQLTLTSIQKNFIISPYNETIYSLYQKYGESYLITLIENNFNIPIDNYVVINKIALKQIVDSTNTIKINNALASGNDILNTLEKMKYEDLLYQEKVQRYVIQELLYGFSRLPFSRYPYVIKQSFPFVKIDLTPFKMLSLGFTALSLKNYTALQHSLP